MLVTSSFSKTDDNSGDLLGHCQWILFIHWIQFPNGLNSSSLKMKWKWPWMLQTFPSVFLMLFWSIEEERTDGPWWFQSLLDFNGLWFGMNFKKQWQLLTVCKINHSNTKADLGWWNTNNTIYTRDTTSFFVFFSSIFQWLKRKLNAVLDSTKY